jgi:hypothetical protein
MDPLSIIGLRGFLGLGAGAALVLAWSFSPWGAETKLDKARETIAELRIELDECEADKAAIELTRSAEADAARDDYAALGVQCSAAASRALASGLSIGRITNDTSTNPDGSPRRRIVGAGELRGAIGQPEPAARP